jgi:CheY-like chemotaxis protein
VRCLFDEYSRFNTATNRTIEGTGLGMNITQHLVRMMDGVISVDSEPGMGAAFTVRLPQRRMDAGILGREVAENLRQFKGDMLHIKKMAQIVRDPMPYGRVLIVDDLETNLYVGKGLMTPYGLSIDTALSGFAAIDKIRHGNEYDIVFMDHMMPKMDGVETTKIMRDMGYARPIVALTANAVAGQAEMFLANGFSDFLSKPIDLRQLNALLNRLVRDKQPPEVIDAARRLIDVPRADDSAPSVVDPQLARIFVRDAQKAMITLAEMYAKRYRRGDDVQMFVTTVHAMKSALGNIGETEAAAFAQRLEQAGRENNTAVMTAETPAFLSVLRASSEKIRPQEEGGDDEAEDGDLAYLHEQLRVIHAACAAFDKKAVKDALAELRQKTWSRQTNEQLEAIAGHLLHRDFEEAAVVAARLGQGR